MHTLGQRSARTLMAAVAASLIFGCKASDPEPESTAPPQASEGEPGAGAAAPAGGGATAGGAAAHETGGEGAAPAAERTGAERASAAAEPVDLSHAEALELLEASDIELEGRDDACRWLARQAPSLGGVVPELHDKAVAQSTRCEPAPEGGASCQTKFREPDDTTYDFDYTVQSGRITPGSLRCTLAG
jgi:hypothetical protein